VYQGKSETPVSHFRCKTKLDGVGSVAECAHKAMSNQNDKTHVVISVERPDIESAPYKDKATLEYKDCFEPPWKCKTKYYGYPFEEKNELNCYVYDTTPVNITEKIDNKDFRSTADTLCRLVQKNDVKYSEFNTINDDLGCARFAGLYQERFNGVSYSLTLSCADITDATLCNQNSMCKYDKTCIIDAKCA
jgi:hypothetical protein